MADAYRNLAIASVLLPPTPATSGTSLVVGSGQGARFPVAPFNATLWPPPYLPDPTNAEIVRVTGVVGDTFTLLRAQEGTSPRAIAAGDLIANTVTKKLLDELVTSGPPGAEGPPGPPGEDGADGLQGVPGPPGPSGAAGAKGDKGDPGAPGAAGAQGPPGPQGDPGSTGPIGPEGPPGTGIAIQGSVPSAGALPPTGNPGDAWITTDTGHMWVWDDTPPPGSWVDAGQSQGPPGPAGPQGIQGEQGLQGIQGVPGTPGATGATGPAGADGEDGTDGAPGAVGPEGPPGPKGDTGATGATGPKGDTGDTGPAGTAGPHATTHQPGGADPMAVDAVAATGSLRTLGTGAQQAAPGNDARLTNARTPTAHAASHNTGGSDPLTALSADILTSGTLPVARLGAGTLTVLSKFDTGSVNGWAPGLVGNTLIFWQGVADFTINNLAAGAFPGQLVTIKNVNNGPVIYCRHNINTPPLFNLVTSGPTPVAYGGSVTYVWQATPARWVLLDHEQGLWITPTYAGGDYTGGWGVEAGDVDHCEYRLSGTLLTVRLAIFGSSVSGTPASLLRVIPGGFSAAKATYVGTLLCSNAGAALAAVGVSVAPGTSMSFTPTIAGGSWTTSTNLTNLYGTLQLAVS